MKIRCSLLSLALVCSAFGGVIPLGFTPLLTINNDGKVDLVAPPSLGVGYFPNNPDSPERPFRFSPLKDFKTVEVPHLDFELISDGSISATSSDRAYTTTTSISARYGFASGRFSLDSARKVERDTKHIRWTLLVTKTTKREMLPGQVTFLDENWRADPNFRRRYGSYIVNEILFGQCLAVTFDFYSNQITSYNELRAIVSASYRSTGIEAGAGYGKSAEEREISKSVKFRVSARLLGSQNASIVSEALLNANHGLDSLREIVKQCAESLKGFDSGAPVAIGFSFCGHDALGSTSRSERDLILEKVGKGLEDLYAVKLKVDNLILGVEDEMDTVWPDNIPQSYRTARHALNAWRDKVHDIARRLITIGRNATELKEADIRGKHQEWEKKIESEVDQSYYPPLAPPSLSEVFGTSLILQDGRADPQFLNTDAIIPLRRPHGVSPRTLRIVWDKMTVAEEYQPLNEDGSPKGSPIKIISPRFMPGREPPSGQFTMAIYHNGRQVDKTPLVPFSSGGPNDQDVSPIRIHVLRNLRAEDEIRIEWRLEHGFQAPGRAPRILVWREYQVENLGKKMSKSWLIEKSDPLLTAVGGAEFGWLWNHYTIRDR